VSAAERPSAYIIHVAQDGSPLLLGPYDSPEERRRAYIEFAKEGETVYWLDVNRGVPYVGRHWGWR
jgi:hypothetical protein